MQQDPDINEYSGLDMRVWLLERRVQRIHSGLDNVEWQLKDIAKEVKDIKTQMHRSFLYIAAALVISNLFAFYF